MLLRSLILKSTLPTTLSTWTLLLNPFGMSIPWVLFSGNPEPLHVTVFPDIAHPAMFKLAALIGIPPAWRSAIASGMLLAQSPAMPNEQVGVSGTDRCCIDGLVTPPNELPTL